MLLVHGVVIGLGVLTMVMVIGETHRHALSDPATATSFLVCGCFDSPGNAGRMRGLLVRCCWVLSSAIQNLASTAVNQNAVNQNTISLNTGLFSPKMVRELNATIGTATELFLFPLIPDITWSIPSCREQFTIVAGSASEYTCIPVEHSRPALARTYHI